MYVELCTYNKGNVDTVDDCTREVFRAISLKFDGICVDLHLLRRINSYLAETKIKRAVPVDYPLGIADTKNRHYETNSCVREEADFVDLVLNPHMLREKQYRKLGQELRKHCQICENSNTTVRAMIGYGEHTTRSLVDIARVVGDAGCEFILPSPGYHREDIAENLVVARSMEKNSNISAISTGHIWLKKQYEIAIKAKIFGLRMYSTQIFTDFSVHNNIGKDDNS